MHSVEFVQSALHERVAPPSLGSVGRRLQHATRVLSRRQWSANRVRDCWYADPRISLNAEEVRDIEELTGLRYGRQELKEFDELIARADSLLEGQDADFYRPFVAALRAFAGALYSSRAEGE